MNYLEKIGEGNTIRVIARYSGTLLDGSFIFDDIRELNTGKLLVDRLNVKPLFVGLVLNIRTVGDLVIFSAIITSSKNEDGKKFYTLKLPRNIIIIRQFIFSNQIVYGILDDFHITHYVLNEEYKERLIEVDKSDLFFEDLYVDDLEDLDALYYIEVEDSHKGYKIQKETCDYRYIKFQDSQLLIFNNREQAIDECRKNFYVYSADLINFEF